MIGDNGMSRIICECRVKRDSIELTQISWQYINVPIGIIVRNISTAILKVNIFTRDIIIQQRFWHSSCKKAKQQPTSCPGYCLHLCKLGHRLIVVVSYALAFSPSCYIISLINIDNWPCLRINNFQQMNQTRTLAETSKLHDLRALQVLIDQSEKYVSETQYCFAR